MVMRFLRCPFCKQISVGYKVEKKTEENNPWQPYTMYACDNCTRTFEMIDGKLIEYKVRGR